MKISKKKKDQRKEFLPKPLKPCWNCGELCNGHFVPPSLGEDGFYICENKIK